MAFPVTYITFPSSPTDQSKYGESGTLASRFTREWWQWHFQIGTMGAFSVSNRNICPSAAAVATFWLLGMNFTENILPWCGVRNSNTLRCLNGSQIMTRQSSEPDANSVPVEFHSRQFTQPLCPSRMASNSRRRMWLDAYSNRFLIMVSMS